MDKVKGVRFVDSTSDTLTVVFEPPEGYYDMIYFFGYDESDTYEFSAVASSDTDQIKVISLVPGNMITYYFETISNKDPENSADSDYFYAFTSKAPELATLFYSSMMIFDGLSFSRARFCRFF